MFPLQSCLIKKNNFVLDSGNGMIMLVHKLYRTLVELQLCGAVTVLLSLVSGSHDQAHSRTVSTVF